MHNGTVAPYIEPAAACRILVVEDEESINDVVATALRYEGHSVTRVQDGANANTAVAEAATSELGPVDILVHSAGVASYGSDVVRTDPDEVGRLFGTHALGAWSLAKGASTRHPRERRRPRPRRSAPCQCGRRGCPGERIMVLPVGPTTTGSTVDLQVECVGDRERPKITTLAPALQYAWAVARPIPLVPPVITAILSRSLMGFIRVPRWDLSQRLPQL